MINKICRISSIGAQHIYWILIYLYPQTLTLYGE